MGSPIDRKIKGANLHPVFSSSRQSTEYDNDTDRSYLSLGAEADSLNGQAMASGSIVNTKSEIGAVLRGKLIHEVHTPHTSCTIPGISLVALSLLPSSMGTVKSKQGGDNKYFLLPFVCA